MGDHGLMADYPDSDMFLSRLDVFANGNFTDLLTNRSDYVEKILTTFYCQLSCHRLTGTDPRVQDTGII